MTNIQRKILQSFCDYANTFDASHTIKLIDLIVHRTKHLKNKCLHIIDVTTNDECIDDSIYAIVDDCHIVAMMHYDNRNDEFMIIDKQFFDKQ
jgi:hypothetical protein